MVSGAAMIVKAIRKITCTYHVRGSIDISRIDSDVKTYNEEDGA